MKHPQHRPLAECWPCIMDISLGALDRVLDDEEIKFRVMKEVAATAACELDRNSDLPAVSSKLFRIISEMTGCDDPFRREKRECNEVAAPLSHKAREEIMHILDRETRLRQSILASIAGNTMDLGTSGHTFNLAGFEEEYRRTLSQGLAVDHTHSLMQELQPGRRLLYLADNAGEIAFDKILVEVIAGLGPEVTVAVKGGPISNDATIEDAKYVGMEEVADVITTGTAHLGVNLNEASDEFRDSFFSAELLLSKGQSNFETLCYDSSCLSVPVAYVLKAKCRPIAKVLGVEVGDNVMKLVPA